MGAKCFKKKKPKEPPVTKDDLTSIIGEFILDDPPTIMEPDDEEINYDKKNICD